MIQTFEKDLLKVRILPDRATLGQDAGGRIANKIRQLLEQKAIVNLVFGAAPSQDETLEALIESPGIDWTRINAFHMDEYIGLEPESPQRFAHYLKYHLFDRVPFREVFLIDGNAPDPEKECLRYAALLEQYPPDITCLGIGENTHIAFNDPYIADFNDPALVKVVDMDLQCRTQQVNDKCFDTIEEVPRQAITLTVPALFRTAHAFCMVPGRSKAQAVQLTLTSVKVTNRYPATILRTHPDAELFIDPDSGSLLPGTF